MANALATNRKQTIRRAMYVAANWRCQMCSKQCRERMDCRPGENFLTLDHVIPRCKGGPSQQWNLAVVCDACNHAKGSKLDISVWGQHPPWQYFAWQAQQEGLAILRRHNTKVRVEAA